MVVYSLAELFTAITLQKIYVYRFRQKSHPLLFTLKMRQNFEKCETHVQSFREGPFMIKTFELRSMGSN